MDRPSSDVVQDESGQPILVPYALSFVGYNGETPPAPKDAPTRSLTGPVP